MLGHSIVSQHFMEPEGSIPNSQELSTRSHPEPDQSSPHHPITSPRSILILSTHLRLGLLSGLFPSGYIYYISELEHLRQKSDKLWVRQPWFEEQQIRFFLLCNFQTGSRVHPTSYIMGTRGTPLVYSSHTVKLTIHLSSVKVMNGRTIPPLLYMYSWHGD
jgi:hypothetical protein